jgi:hypothetical protein
MPNTTWKLTLTDAGSRPAKRITAALTPMLAALRAVAGASAGAQAALARVAPAGTAVQIRAATAAIREQSRALRELNGLQGRGGGRTPRATPARPRSPTATPSGRVALGPDFTQRALGLQMAYRTRAGAQQVRQTQRERAVELRAHQSYFQRLSRMTQQSFRENARLSAQQSRASAAAGRARVQSMQQQSGAASALLGTVGGVALGAVAALAGIATAFAGVGYSAAAAVIEVAAFRESSLVALTAVLGSSQAAGRQFRNAVTVANQTPLDTRDVIAQTQSFAVAGFGEREIAPLIAASADLGAAFGQRSSEGFALALSQIRSAGRLQGQELLQLSNANVSRSAILDSIARQMNLGQGEVGRRAAQTAITQRRVSSGVGEQAALDAVRGRLDGGGALGTFARQQSETLTGAISNARNAIFNLLIGIDFGNVPGIVAFKNVLLQVTSALQTGSPAATRLRAGITGAANAVGALLARVVNPTTISAGMAALSTGFATVQRFATTAWPIVQAFVRGVGPGFMAGIAPLRAMFASLASGGGPSAQTLALMARAALGLGQAFGFVAGAAVTLFGAVNTLFVILGGIGATITGLVAGIAMQVSQAFMSVGTNIIAGIRTGVLGALPSLGTMMSGVGTSLVGAVTSTLGIRSPSRVFADVVGRQIPAGIAMGVNAGAPVANDAVSGIVSPRVPELGGRGGASVSIEINVTGGGQPQETARAIRAEMEDALGSIFGQWAEASP